MAAPFLGITPETSLENTFGNDLSSSSPLYVSVLNLASTLESRPTLAKAPEMLRELVSNAWKAGM